VESLRGGVRHIRPGLVYGDLAQQQVISRGPGLDQVQRRLPLGPVEAAAADRAVYGDDLTAGRLLQLLDPAQEAPLELVGSASIRRRKPRWNT
jgi:hypothetical protein